MPFGERLKPITDSAEAAAYMWPLNQWGTVDYVAVKDGRNLAATLSTLAGQPLHTGVNAESLQSKEDKKAAKIRWAAFWEYVMARVNDHLEPLWSKNGPFNIADLLGCIVPTGGDSNWHGPFALRLREHLSEEWEVRSFGPNAVMIIKVTWR